MSEDRAGATGMPASFELAWGVRERPTKGPKRGLSLEQVVRAGVTVAVTEGLGAVSMNRVAKEVGTSAMALYRYVAAKDELLMLMVDEALGESDFTAGDGGWRVELQRWAWAEVEAYRRHPWVLQVPITGPPLTPKIIAFLEQGLRCLSGTPLTPGDKMSTILTLTSFNRAFAMLDAQLDPAYADGDYQTLIDYSRALAAVADPEKFPALHDVLDASVFTPKEDETVDHDFVFGLARLMDGFEVLITSRTV
jgi:AcrR family transcriptional regulator